jgi:xylulokinase
MGVPVAVLETTEAASLGVALLAGQAAGLVADLKAALAGAVRFAYVCDPDPGRTREYAARYDVYRDVYSSLRDVNHRLAALDR